MSITIHTEPLAYTEFRDFIISSANWFVPSLLQMPNLDEWILKMYHNGSMYYTISGSNIISLKSASNLNGNLNCSKELEHYAS